MKIHFEERRMRYDGSQLRPLYLYEHFDLLGDACGAWIGPCDVGLNEMVDGEDKKARAKICASEMVHFLFEVFRVDLCSAVLLQRICASLVKDWLVAKSPSAVDLRRSGDDLFLGGKKLSISIATRSVNSCLVHFAVNVTNDGTPVPTVCLRDFLVNESEFATGILQLLEQEWRSTIDATMKVFGR